MLAGGEGAFPPAAPAASRPVPRVVVGLPERAGWLPKANLTQPCHGPVSLLPSRARATISQASRHTPVTVFAGRYGRSSASRLTRWSTSPGRPVPVPGCQSEVNTSR